MSKIFSEQDMESFKWHTMWPLLESKSKTMLKLEVQVAIDEIKATGENYIIDHNNEFVVTRRTVNCNGEQYALLDKKVEVKAVKGYMYYDFQGNKLDSACSTEGLEDLLGDVM